MEENETVDQPEAVPAPVDETPEVQGEVPLAPDNRPAQNVLGEMQRKYAQLQQGQNELLAELRAIRAERQAPAPQPAQAGAEYSDDQLAQLAAAGNAEAHRLLVQRSSSREAAQLHNAWTQEQGTRNAVQQLISRYPVLNDPQHPLTQAVYSARNTYFQSGWKPGPLTDLEAIKAAIVANPHLATQTPATTDTTRRAAVIPQQSIDGAAPRRSPQQQPRQGGSTLNDKVKGVAQRMEVKDPDGSIKRMAERQRLGRSAVSPAVQQAVRDQGDA
jgi:hypothetical protein